MFVDAPLDPTAALSWFQDAHEPQPLTGSDNYARCDENHFLTTERTSRAWSLLDHSTHLTGMVAS